MKSILALMLILVASSLAEEEEQKIIDLKEILDTFLNGLKGVAKESTILMLEQMKEKLNSLIGKRAVLDYTKLQEVKDLLESIKEKFVEKLKEVYEKFADKLKEAYPNLLTDFLKGKREVEAATEDAKRKITDILKEILEHVKKLGVGIATNTLDKIMQLLQGEENEKNESNNEKRAIKEALESLFEKLKGHLQNVGDAVIEHKDNILEKLKPHFEDLLEQMKAHGVNAAQSIIDALAEAAKSLGY